MYEDLSTKPGCPVCRSQGFLSVFPLRGNRTNLSRISKPPCFEIRERFGSCFLVSLQLVPFPFYLFKLHSTTTSIPHFHAEDGEPCFRASCYSSAGCFSWVSWHKSFGAVIKVLYLSKKSIRAIVAVVRRQYECNQCQFSNQPSEL